MSSAGRLLSTVIAALLMSACASTPSSRLDQDIERALRESRELSRQGRADEALKRLEDALRTHPDNLELRTYTIHQRDLRVGALLRQSDLQRERGALDEAARGYAQVQAIAGDDPRVTDGQRLVERARAQGVTLDRARALIDAHDLDAAQSAVREVLAVEPWNVRARGLYEEIEQARGSPAALSAKLERAFARKVTLQFKDAPLNNVLDVVHKIAGINFSYDTEMRPDQKISLLIKDTPVSEALNVILSTHRLAYKPVGEATLLVYPENRAGSPGKQVVRSFFLTNAGAKQMSNLIKSVVKSKDVHIDETLNLLVVRDTPDAIALIEKLVLAQDLADPEVMLEVEVLEVNRKQLEAIGARWPTQIGLGVRGRLDSDGSTGSGVTRTPGVLSLSELRNFNGDLGVFTVSDPALLLNLLQSDTETNLLANPHIRVKSREKAKVHIGDRIPVITSIANSTGFVSESVSYLDVGIKLDVEPQVQLNDEVTIKVALEVSNQTDQVKTSSGTLTYTIGTRNANTILRLRNGETQVLAGLFRNDSQAIRDSTPGLSRVPGIGRLFDNRDTDRRKKEIVLLITPRVLRNIVPPVGAYRSLAAGEVREQVAMPVDPAQAVPSPASPVPPPGGNPSSSADTGIAQPPAR